MRLMTTTCGEGGNKYEPTDELAPPWYREKLGCSAAKGVARMKALRVVEL